MQASPGLSPIEKSMEIGVVIAVLFVVGCLAFFLSPHAPKPTKQAQAAGDACCWYVMLTQVKHGVFRTQEGHLANVGTVFAGCCVTNPLFALKLRRVGLGNLVYEGLSAAGNPRGKLRLARVTPVSPKNISDDSLWAHSNSITIDEILTNEATLQLLNGQICITESHAAPRTFSRCMVRDGVPHSSKDDDAPTWVYFRRDPNGTFSCTLQEWWFEGNLCRFKRL